MRPKLRIHIPLQEGIEAVSAAYDAFVEQDDFDDFSNYVFELQTNAKHALKPQRIKEYLKIVLDSSGKDMCHAVFHYIIVVLGKYLQMMIAYYINKKDSNRVTKEFEKFNDTYEKLTTYFEKVTGEVFLPGHQNLDQLDSSDVMKLQDVEAFENEQTRSIDPVVVKLLDDLKLMDLKEIFEREALSIEDIQDMNNGDLKDIGVPLFKQRKAILSACKEMKATKDDPKSQKKEVSFRMKSESKFI